MRVAFESQRLLRKSRYGMDIVGLELLKNMAKKSNEITLLSAKGPNREELPQNIQIKEEGPSLFPLWEQLYLPKQLETGEFNVAHFTANTAPLKVSIPSVVTLHDVIFMDPLYKKRGGTLYQQAGSLYRKEIVKRIVKSCSRVVTVSNYEKEHIVNITGVDESRISVIYNGVSEKFRPVTSLTQKELIKKRYSLPNEYMLFFGNSDGKKNTVRTVKAFIEWKKMNRNSCSLVITNLTESLYHRILMELGEKEVPHYIKLLKFVDHNDLPTLYSMASLYLYPSIAESFGLSILEAMGCGTPVVTSGVTAMPEIGGKCAEYVNPYSIASIIAGINHVYSNSNLQKRMVARGKKRVNEFAWERAADSYLEIYRDLCS